MRNGVKCPAQFSRARIVSAYVPRRIWLDFRHAAANNQHVFVDDSRRGHRDPVFYFPSQVLAQIQMPISTERLDGLSSVGIQRVQILPRRYKNPPVFVAVRPIRHSAIAHFVVEKLKGLFVPRIKAPTKFPRSSIQRNHIRSGSGGIQSPAYDDGVTLHFGIAPRVFGVEGPHNLQLLYVVAINLLEAGVAGVVGAAAVNTPRSMV